MINPLFSDLLRESAYNPESLFPSVSVHTEEEPPSLWLSETLLGAFLSFVLRRLDILKADGSMKKKTEEEIGQVLPVLLKDAGSGTRFSVLLYGLKNLGLLGKTGSFIKPDLEKWKAFAMLPEAERFFYFTAAASIMHEDVSLKAAREAASGMRDFFGALPPGRALSTGSLSKLAFTSFAERGFTGYQYEYLIDTLSCIGVLVPFKDLGFYIHPDLLRFLGNTEPGSAEEAVKSTDPGLILQPDFTITVKPGISMEDCITLACASDIERYDIYPHYVLSKLSFIRALEYGITATKLLSMLQKLSGQTVPQNVSFSVRNWEKDYESLKFFKGIVCVADSEKAHIIENTDLLKPWIRKTFARGVYLFDEGEREQWESALKEQV